MADDAIETLGRAAVHSFLQNQLGPIPVPEWMLDLARHEWLEVYTTNYDATADRVRHLHGGNRRPRLYFGGELPVDGLHGQKPVYHLMGSLDREPGAPGSLILTVDDRVQRANELTPYYRRLKDHLDDGVPLVIVGHSLRDHVLRDAIKSTQQALPTGTSGRVYVVTPEAPKGAALRGLNSLDLVHVPADAQQLSEALGGARLAIPGPAGRVVAFAGEEVALSGTTIRSIGRYTSLIDERFEGESNLTQDQFYASSLYKREAFGAEWDFRRDLMRVDAAEKPIGEALATDDARKLLHKTMQEHDLSSALLLGGPGSAKTMTALRFAYDWTLQGGIVLHFDGHRGHAHGQQVAQLAKSLQEDIRSAGVDPCSGPGLLIIMDGYVERRHVLLELERELRRANVEHAMMLAVGRFADAVHIDRSTVDLEFQLDPQITDGEHERLHEWLERVSGRSRTEVLLAAQQGSYWGAIYTLLDPTKPPMEEAITQLFGRLDSWRKELVATAAVFDALGIELPWKIARRIPGPDAASLTEMQGAMESAPAAHLVLLRETTDYRALSFINPLAAGILVEKIIHPTMGCASLIQRCIDVTYRDFVEEARALESSLIPAIKRRNLLQSGRGHWITNEDREELYGKAAKMFQSPMFYQHHGIALKDLNQFEDARDEILRGIRESRDQRFMARAYNSLAHVKIRWARFTGPKDRTKALELLEEAKGHLEHCDKDGFYYNAVAQYYLERSRHETGPMKAVCLSECILNTKHGAAIAESSEERDEFRQSEDSAFEELTRLDFDETLAAEVAREYRSGVGYYAIAARCIRNDGLSIRDEDELGVLLRHASKAVEYSPTLEPAWDLYARLLRKKDPEDVDDLLTAVQHLSTPAIKLNGLLMLAAARYAAGDHKECNRLMGEVQGNDPGHVVLHDRVDDLIIRKRGSPILGVVKGSPEHPDLVVDGVRIPLRGATLGVKWLVRVDGSGLKAVRPVGAAHPP